MNKLWALLIPFWKLPLLLLSPLHMQAQGPAVMHSIVMQLTSSEPEVHKALFNQLQALKERWADSVKVEVVVHGPGIEILLKEKTPWHPTIQNLRAQGVVFLACENTLKQKKIPREALVGDIGFIPFGLVYIVQKQEQGWSYLKAGF
ncbi:MAG: DsrE family protein [Flavobacteriales bacterium]|nr:DsrE family protein [Flavobacteriales bacterium]MDW8431456.1 DsrE family protein [Flavobacteriales bacterium]